MQQQLYSQLAHMMKRLTNGGEARCLESCLFNIVEADHRHVLWHPQPRIMECANTTDGRNIVERENRGKTALMSQ